MMSFEKKFDTAIPIIKALQAFGDGGALFFDLGREDTETRISYFPADAVRADVLRYALSVCRRMEKNNDGCMQGVTENGVRLVLFGVMVCTIIGHETVEEPVMVPNGEIRRIEKPIYECRSPLGF